MGHVSQILEKADMHLIFMTLASLDFFVIETCQKYHFSNKTIAIVLNKYMMDLKNSVHRTNLWFQVDLENKNKIQQINML